MAVQVLTHLLLLLLASACTSNHRVSPFPPVGLTVFLCPADDLPGQLERATREAVASGLRETLRIKGTLPDGKPFVALGFSGIDPAGLPTHATRVVTPASVVLALGPAHVVLQELPRPDELLPALHPSGAYPSGVDLTGDQAPDVILRASDGTLAIYRIDLLGSTPYPIQLRAPPTWALDLDEDGRPDLAGLVPVPEDDAIHPELLDIAVADGTGFRNDHPAVLAHHRAMAERPMPPGSAPFSLRLRAALERTFHQLAAGDPMTQALRPTADLVAEHHPLPPPLAASWARWRAWLDRAFPSGTSRGSPG